MKKFLVLALAALLSFSLMACAGAAKKEQIRIKCPACGYEFVPGR